MRIIRQKPKDTGTFRCELIHDQLGFLRVTAALYQFDRMTPRNPQVLEVLSGSFTVAKITVSAGNLHMDLPGYEPLPVLELSDSLNAWQRFWTQWKIKRIRGQNVVRASIPQVTQNQLADLTWAIALDFMAQYNGRPKDWYERQVYLKLQSWSEALRS